MIVSMLSLAIYVRSLARCGFNGKLPLGIFVLAGFSETFICLMFALAFMFHEVM